MQNPYVTLGVRPTATAEDIKAAYRKRARRYHPDQSGGDAKAAAKMAELNAAYDRLTGGQDAAVTHRAPTCPTTYLRMLNENERAKLGKAAKAAASRSAIERLKAKLGRPVAKTNAVPVTLSCLRLDDVGLHLTFEGGPLSENILLVMPNLAYDGDGSLRVIDDAPRVIDATAREGHSLRPVEPTTFVSGFDGPVRLHFDI